MNLRDKLRALEEQNEEFQSQLENEINLKLRIESIEQCAEKHYDEIRKVVKKRFEKLAYIFDSDFQYYWDQWASHNDSVSRTRANFLLHYMAILKTKGYKKRRDEIDHIASELDIPHFTPHHFMALVGDDFRARNEMMKIRRNTRLLFYRDELGNLIKSKPEYRPILDFLVKHLIVCTNEEKYQ